MRLVRYYFNYFVKSNCIGYYLYLYFLFLISSIIFKMYPAYSSENWLSIYKQISMITRRVAIVTNLDFRFLVRFNAYFQKKKKKIEQKIVKLNQNRIHL